MAFIGSFQFRRDIATNWTASNPVLLSGELGIETNTQKFKIGDGTSAWNILPYGGIQGPQGTAGRGITSITRTAGTGAAGTTDTYTITYTDATTSTFMVVNGANGTNGTNGTNGVSVAVFDEGTQLTATASSLNFVGGGVTATNTGNAVTVTVPPAPTAASTAPADLGNAAVGTSATYARSDHVHGHGAQGGGTQHSAATTTTAGFMSATDKAKLDGVASGATANTAATAAPPAVAASSAVGTAAAYAREDHTHGGVTSAAAGTGISVSAATGAVTVTNTDTGSAARTAHEAAADPHPQYATAAEAAAAAPVQSVDGRTGAVTFLQSNRATEFISTANNATVQVVQTLVVPAARIAAGLSIEITVFGTQTNVATSGGNNGVVLQVNGTAIATANVAVGTTAQTNRSFRAIGAVTFRSATQVVGGIEHAITGILPVSATNAAAPTTIAAGDVTIGVAVQTATANAGNTIRVGIAILEEA